MPTKSEPFRSGSRGVGLVTTSVLLSLYATASAGNALENAIERAQPCRSLKVDTGLFTVGVDKFEKVE